MRALAAFVLAAVGTFVVGPRLLFRLAGAAAPRRARALPWLAVGLFLVAWYLPNPDLAHTDTFVQHAVGGGASCAALGLFLALNAGLRSPVLRVGLAYAVAASFGVTVELAELAADVLLPLDIEQDVAWDLLANSVGAVAAAVVLELGWRRGRRWAWIST